MYSIYADGVCIYNDVFSLDDMKVVNPKLTLEDSAAGSLEMTLPHTNKAYDTIIRMVTEISVKKHGEEIWSGRVLSESKDFWNNRVLYCEGELAYFNDSVQPPAEYAGKSVRKYLEQLISVHNAKVGANRQFAIGAVTVVDENFPTYCTNYEKTMELLNALVETYGGHLRVRKVDGVRYLDYLKEYPDTCSQVIQFGSNLIDFTRNWDSTEYATAIVPLGNRLDESPIDPNCDCPVCRRYSRAYVRHLFIAEEMLAMRLAVMHNLYFYNKLMERIRQALDEGRFEEFRREYSAKLARRI